MVKENEPDAGSKPSTSSQPMNNKVRIVINGSLTTLHTPIWLNGVRFPQCLIDIGSEVNLIYVRDAIKYGMHYEMGSN